MRTETANEQAWMGERIRVLLVIGEMSGGGSERQTLGILKWLDRDRFAPHLYLISPGGQLLPEVPEDVPVSVFWQRHRPPRWNWPGRVHRAQVRDLARVLREQRIDIVYDRTYHMALLTAAATRRLRVPRVSVIVTHPQLDFEASPERFRAVKRLLLQRAYRSADQVVAVSEGTRRAAANYYGLAPESIRTLYNFLDLRRLKQSEQHGMVPPGFEPDRFHIVASGRLHEAKAYPLLIEAVRMLVRERGLQQLRLHILGTGSQQSELDQLIRRKRLEQHVQLEGFQSDPFAYYRNADLFVLSSLYEGMPNVLIEAMACGVPVLSTDCPYGPREILEQGRLGHLVPPGSSAALADAIEDAAEHYESWQARTAEARHAALTQFGPERGIARVESLLHEVLARSRRGLANQGYHR